MIHADDPLQSPIENAQPPVISKVYGFGTAPASQPTQDTKPNQQEPTLETLHELEKKHSFKEHFFHWWHKVATILLIGHSLYDLWKGVGFLVFEYPEINHLFEQHLVEAHEINSLLGEALVDLAAASIAIFFTVRMIKVKETTEHNIDLIASTILILSTGTVQQLFIQLDLLNLILYTFAR